MPDHGRGPIGRRGGRGVLYKKMLCFHPHTHTQPHTHTSPGRDGFRAGASSHRCRPLPLRPYSSPSHLRIIETRDEKNGRTVVLPPAAVDSLVCGPFIQTVT